MRPTMMIGSLAAAAAAALAATAPSAAQATAAAAASLDVFPVPAVSGQQVSVVGHGFCATIGCSQVTVSIETTTVASGVKVGSDGGFTTSFPITVVPGDHDVTATQQTPAGDITATAHVVVLPLDNRTTPPPAPTSQPRPTGTAGGATTTRPSPGTGPGSPGTASTGPTPSSTAAAAANDTTLTSGRSPLWWAAGLGLLVLIGAAVWILRRRRTPRQ